MPSKKRTEPAFTPEEVEQIDAAQADPGLQEVGKKMVETVDELISSIGTCGHVNKQHYNAKGRLEDLACDLEPKHAGDHHAKYQKKVGEPVTDEKGRVVKVEYHEEESDAYWTSAAGKPARDISEGTTPQLNLLQKDLLAQIMKRNPDMSVEVALEKAKTDPQWNVSTAPS